jgi:hypothetical protein
LIDAHKLIDKFFVCVRTIGEEASSEGGGVQALEGTERPEEGRGTPEEGSQPFLFSSFDLCGLK